MPESPMLEMMTLHPPMEGPAAWVGADLAKRPQDWTYVLSPTEVGEIEAATAAVAGHDIAGLQRSDFLLPTL